MKKVLIAILAVVALASCQQEDAPQGVKYPILFGSTDTRAVADLDDLKDSGFKVYAYFQGTAEGTGSSTFEKTVTYYEDDDVWTYEGLEYWISGVNYWFKAFYPAQLTAGTLAVDNTVTDDSVQSFTITNFDITKQEDVMVAEATASVPNGATCPTDGSVVNLNFKHLLANVTIKAKSQIDGVIMQKIVIGSADTNSTYNGSVWSLSGNTTSIEYSQPTTLTKGAEFVDVTNGGILVIPASTNKKTLTIQANKTYNLEFPTGTWEPGKRYTYTLEIKQDDIIFVDDAPYVEEWDSENATGSVIIK